MELNYYKSVNQPKVNKNIQIDEWLDNIKFSSFSNLILSARNGKINYDDVKLTKVPAVTYNFKYKKYKKDTNIIDSTGFIYFDIDDPSFNPEILDKTKIFAYYHSFGGFGYSIIIKVKGINKDNFNFNYIRIAKELGIINFIDINAIKASQFNVLSFDPYIYINTSSFVFSCFSDISSIVIKQYNSNIYNNINKIAYTKVITAKNKFIRFSNIDEINVDGEYNVNWTGYDIIKCWIPIHKKKIGRNNMLLSYCNNLVYLNSYITEEKIFDILKKVNYIAFETPVNDEQLNRIINSVLKYKEDGTLKPIYFNKKRKIVFNKDSKLNKEEKLNICSIELAKKRTEDSKQKLYNIIEDWDFNTYGKISQRKIYNNFNICQKTVEKYYNEFKEYISDLNNMFNNKYCSLSLN